MKSALTDELHHLAVGHDRGLAHQGVIGEELPAGACVADQEFAEDKVVPADLALPEQLLERACVRRPIGEEANPD